MMQTPGSSSYISFKILIKLTWNMILLCMLISRRIQIIKIICQELRLANILFLIFLSTYY